MADFTEGTLLGGRVKYWQFKAGHRTGFEPVLLAACVPARPGERVLELGTGAGAGLLCLAARVPGIWGAGVEVAFSLTKLAKINFKNNAFHDLFAVNAGAAALPFPPAACHHVLANPPWFSPLGTRSPDRLKALAHTGDDLGGWVREMARVVRPGGSLTLILPAADFSAGASLLRAENCGAITLLPLWPRAGQPAKMVILAARKGSRALDAVLPGLALHEGAKISAAAQAVLRDGAALMPGTA